MAITMENVNTLIWRYLSESGFQHSAFMFQTESMVDNSKSDICQIPSGSLISILQKSLLYMKLEKIVKAAKKDPNHKLHNQISEIESRFPEIIMISTKNARILQGHRSYVFGCHWSPNGKLISTASADGTAIIWEVDSDIPPTPISNSTDTNSHNSMSQCYYYSYKSNSLILGYPRVSLRKVLGTPDLKTMDHGITMIDWNNTGTLFATGSFDHTAQIYTSEGNLYATLTGHTHNVFAVRFSPSGKYIVTCSADKTAILWDVANKIMLHIYTHHMDEILDFVWKNDEIFATASADNSIGICNINGEYQFLLGHTSHVIVVSYSSDGRYLASASEDATVRIWSDNNEPIVYTNHETGVLCIKWVPNSHYTIVSSSQDGAVHVWNAQDGTLLHVIKSHIKNVISLSISPCGSFLAFGGSDMIVDISSIKTGERIATMSRKSPVYEVQWDPSGQFLAICFENSTVAIVQSSLFLH